MENYLIMYSNGVSDKFAAENDDVALEIATKSISTMSVLSSLFGSANLWKVVSLNPCRYSLIHKFD